MQGARLSVNDGRERVRKTGKPAVDEEGGGGESAYNEDTNQTAV